MAAITELKQKIIPLTGEIIASSSRELPDYFDPEKGYKLMARSKNVRLFVGVDFPSALSRTDLGHLMYLTKTMWANTGVLGLQKSRGFYPFSDAQLLEHLGFSVGRKSTAWLRRMVAMSMLRSVDVNLPDGTRERQWYLNPIHFCPMFITRQAYLIWRDQIEQFVPHYVQRIFDGRD